MKMYNNGQRKGMMYGGGVTPRKPMMMGGLAQQNRKTTTGSAAMMNPMGRELLFIMIWKGKSKFFYQIYLHS